MKSGMRNIAGSLAGLFMISLMTLSSCAASADSFETLLMPGPVISGHEEFEQDCNSCHDTSDKSGQGRLCMDCHAHENIRDDLRQQSGYHGRLPEGARNDCKHCHTEHEGRDAGIVLLSPSTFDHRQSDFPLLDKHLRAECGACHKDGTRYSDAPAACYDCHRESDVHKGRQGKDCGKCHSAKGWKDSRFDHDKTDFPLRGAHKTTACDACHISHTFKDTADTCISCHRIQDIHQGRYDSKCDACHTAEKWDDIRFDHDRDTGYRLTGGHRDAACDACHTSGNIYRTNLKTDCYGCHRHDDTHKGRNGGRCESCHETSSWRKAQFDHARKTDFPLRGKHAKVECIACHKGDLNKDKLKRACYACHRQDDAHNGKQGEQCDDCHNENGWRNNVLFDHDLSHFPLIGMHAAVTCDECHLSEVYSDVPAECNDCHDADDVHKTKLGTNCELCHNPNDWNNWIFDHDKATRFRLEGAHEKLGCYDCHATQTSGPLKTSLDCIVCHRSQDRHDGQFGRDCGRCHGTKNFRDIRMFKPESPEIP
jgi:hypothetical protein